VTWIDEEQEDGCFRLWDFQWALYRNEATFQIDHMGRSLGKSWASRCAPSRSRSTTPAQEMLITAPELNHLRPVTDKVEHLFRLHRLARDAAQASAATGSTTSRSSRPTSSTTPGSSAGCPTATAAASRAMHPLVIEMDEGQDFPENGWIELIETMKHYEPGAQWRCTASPAASATATTSTRWARTPTCRSTSTATWPCTGPAGTPSERKAKIAIYGGTDDNIDYRRNIYGEHGDATNPVFVLHRLMACVRINESRLGHRVQRRRLHPGSRSTTSC
jgi:hypothetical protein